MGHWALAKEHWLRFFHYLPGLQVLDGYLMVNSVHLYPYVLPVTLRRLGLEALTFPGSFSMLAGLADPACLPNLQETPSLAFFQFSRPDIRQLGYSDAEAAHIFKHAATWLDQRGVVVGEGDKAEWEEGFEYFSRGEGEDQEVGTPETDDGQ